jgi:hypothetical protein
MGFMAAGNFVAFRELIVDPVGDSHQIHNARVMYLVAAAAKHRSREQIRDAWTHVDIRNFICLGRRGLCPCRRQQKRSQADSC